MRAVGEAFRPPGAKGYPTESDAPLRAPVVVHRECQPRSTLFVVWNERRQGYTSAQGASDFQGDVRDLMRLHPANTFLVKLSYWLNR